MTLALASNDEIQVKLFDGHPVRIVPKNGDPWVIARDLATPLGITRQVVRTHVAELEAEDKDVYSVDTPGGKQNVAIISESGWLQITCQGRKDSAKRVRKGLADLAVAWRKGQLVPAQQAAPALPSPELAQLPARVDQLAALAAHTEHQQQDLQQQVDGLTSRLNRVEGRPTYKKARYRRPALLDQIRPEDEAAFFAAWREQGGERTTVGQLALMCQQRGLLPSLRVNLKLLGEWLQGHSGVEAGRTNVARWVRLRVAA